MNIGYIWSISVAKWRKKNSSASMRQLNGRTRRHKHSHTCTQIVMSACQMHLIDKRRGFYVVIFGSFLRDNLLSELIHSSAALEITKSLRVLRCQLVSHVDVCLFQHSICPGRLSFSFSMNKQSYSNTE